MKLLWLAFTVLPVLGLAQNTRFQRSFGGSGSENSYSIKRTLDGGYITVGSTTSFGSGDKDVYLVKTNGMGQIQWSKAYGGSKDDVGWKITLATDSGFVIAGTTESYNSNNKDALVFKTDKNGTVVWTRTFASDSAEDAYYVLKSLFSNGYYVIGYVTNDSTGDDGFIAKLGSAGNVRWYKKFGSKGNEEAYSVTEDSRGNVLICGMTNYDSLVQGGTTGHAGTSDAFVAKFDSTGNFKWMRTYGSDMDDVAWDLKTDKNQYLITGWSKGVGTGDNDIFLLMTDTSGAINNLYSYGSMGDDRAFNIQVNSNGTYSIVGYTDPQGMDRDVLHLKITSAGNLQNYSMIGASERDGHWPTDVTTARDGGITILSTTRSFKGSSDDDIYIIKADDGGLVNCNSKFELINASNMTFGGKTFGLITQGYQTQTPSLTTTTISSGWDSTLCCKLVAEVSQPSFTICEGTSVSLGKIGTPGLSYVWTDDKGTTVSTNANPTVSPKSSTTYKLKVTSTDGACAPDSAYVSVTVNARLTFDFARDTFFCMGDSVIFTTRSNMANYQWKGSHINSSSQAIKIKLADTIYFTGYDVNSCVYTDTMKVKTFALPTFDLGTDTTICENTPLTMVGPPNMKSYNWNSGESTKQSFSTNTEKKHVLDVVDQNGCKGSDSRMVFTNPFSTFSLGSDDEICENGAYTILGPGALGNYIWNDTASTLQNLTVYEPGTYHLTAFNSYGCPYSDTIILTQRNAPKFSLGADFNLCIGNSKYLVGPKDMLSYQWLSGSSDDSLKITTSGTYVLAVVDSFGCRFTDSITVKDVPNPVITLGNDTTIYDTDSLKLQPQPGLYKSYLWSTGSTEAYITVKQKGTYSVTVTDDNGCKGSASIKIDTMHVGINPILFNDFKLYPVPATTAIHLEFTSGNAEPLTIRLVNMQGAVLSEQEHFINSGVNSISIPLNEVAAGTYFLQMSNSRGSSTFKVMVE